MPTEQPGGGVPWTRICAAPAKAGGRVEIRGWVTHRRSSGKVQFLVLRDGSGVIQCVAGLKDLAESEWEACARLGQESAVVVRGTLRADARAPGGVELGMDHLRVVSEAE